MNLIELALIGNVERAQLLERLIPLLVVRVLDVPLKDGEDAYKLLECLVLLNQCNEDLLVWLLEEVNIALYYCQEAFKELKVISELRARSMFQALNLSLQLLGFGPVSEVDLSAVLYA